MTHIIRIPPEIYRKLQKIKFSLDPDYLKASPSLQDMVTVALTRFIEDYEHPDSYKQVLNELLEQREIARSRMGR